MLMVAVCVFALFIVLSCVYADRIGRRRVLTFSSVALVVFAVAFPYLLMGEGKRDFVAVMVFLCVGFALMGTAFGPIGAFLPELSDRRGHLPRDQGRRFHQVTDGVCPNPQILTLRAVTFRSKRKDPLIRTKPPFPPPGVRISHPVCLRRSVSMRTSPSNISVAVLERAATVAPDHVGRL